MVGSPFHNHHNSCVDVEKEVVVGVVRAVSPGEVQSLYGESECGERDSSVREEASEVNVHGATVCWW